MEENRRLYYLNDDMEVSWVEVLGHIVKGDGKFSFDRFEVVRDEAGAKDYEIVKSWIWTKQNPSGVYFENKEDLIQKLKNIIFKIRADIEGEKTNNPF